jgi:lipid II:glycine glycyltransferase (peptidoglycan interpeptide bridge formation enzyme)
MEINEKVLKLKIREQELQKELTYWEEEFKPSGNMGKMGRQVRLDKIKEELKTIQEDISFHDTIYLSNEIYNQWKDKNLTN